MKAKTPSEHNTSAFGWIATKLSNNGPLITRQEVLKMLGLTPRELRQLQPAR